MKIEERRLQMLEQYPVVRIFTQDMDTITTIGAWSDCEHELKHLAIEFIEKVKDHYRREAV